MESLGEFFTDLLEKKQLKFSREFYGFIFETIVGATRHKPVEWDEPREQIHISPEQICSLIESRLKEEFGPMARSVLTEWGVRSTRDIGTAVFQLAEGGHLVLGGTEGEEDFARGSFENL